MQKALTDVSNIAGLLRQRIDDLQQSLPIGRTFGDGKDWKSIDTFVAAAYNNASLAESLIMDAQDIYEESE